MKAQDLCFWLQGYFELASPPCLSEQQVEVIKNHIKMVEIHDPGNDGRSRQFCEWLKATLTISRKGNMSPAFVVCIAKALEEVFLHEIDPSYPPEQQQELNQAHQGWGSPASAEPSPIGWDMKPGQRC